MNSVFWKTGICLALAWFVLLSACEKDPVLPQEDQAGLQGAVDSAGVSPEEEVSFRGGEAQIPLYSWFSPSRGDNFATTDPAWAGRPGDVMDPVRDHYDYRFARREGYVFAPDRPRPTGTVPLYSWWSPSRADNFITTNPAWGGPLGASRSPDYRCFRLEGYIYSPSRPRPAGTVPLYSWWSPSRADNFATTDPSWSRSLGVRRAPDYAYYRLEGYVSISPAGAFVIPSATWDAALEGLLSRTSLHLNNYTPDRHRYDPSLEKAYFKPDDSYFQVVMGGVTFNQPIYLPVLRKNPSSIYVVDINSDRITADPVTGRIRLSILMEDEGPEFWTNCVNDFWCGAIGNRNVQMNTAVVYAYLTPTVRAGRLSYSNVQVELRSTIRVDGCQDDLFAFLCDIFAPDRSNEIKANVESKMKEHLMQPDLVSMISGLISESLGIGSGITDISINDSGNLIVER